MIEPTTPGYQMDDLEVICPHCLYAYQPEASDYDGRERVEDCENCGMEFIRHDEATITYHTRPVPTL